MNIHRPALVWSRYSVQLLPYILAGFLPVSAIALHCMDLIDIRASLAFIIIPVFTFLVADSSEKRPLFRLLGRAWLAGVIAVAFYDLSRIPFVYMGWDDFIPNIGAWLSDSSERNAVTGYLWRYIGNGGCLGISFFLLMKIDPVVRSSVKAGVAFGLFVFLCLVALLVIFPHAQDLMFPVTIVSFTGGLMGHIVYGLVLGILYSKWEIH